MRVNVPQLVGGLVSLACQEGGAIVVNGAGGFGEGGCAAGIA